MKYHCLGKKSRILGGVAESQGKWCGVGRKRVEREGWDKDEENPTEIWQKNRNP